MAALHRRQNGPPRRLRLGAVGLALVVVAPVVFVSAWLLIPRDDHGRRALHQPAAQHVAGQARAAPRPATYPVVSGGHWARVLARLDERRREAWRTGDPGLLRAVWAAGSTGRATDRRMLGAYGGRGLVVRGVGTDFAQVHVLHESTETVRLLTVDRLWRASAVRAGDGRLELPRDRWTRHVIVLTCGPQGWRILTVRAR